MRILLTLALVASFALGATVAQYPEICHWECEYTWCDGPYDDCEYECHEVCYPWRRADQLSAIRSPAPALNPLLRGMQRRTQGKSVRMRLANRSHQSASRGQFPKNAKVLPKGFALFDGCLGSQNNFGNQDEQLHASGQQLTFGTPDVHISAKL